jgi:putative membrane protein
MEEQTLPATAPVDLSTQLAINRTRAAYERTMMSWIRTATSLITFGFTIYKFFQIEVPPRRDYLIGPREFAIALVSIGLLSLLLAALENRENIRALGPEHAPRRRSLAGIVAALISLLGVIAFVAMIFRQ